MSFEESKPKIEFSRRDLVFNFPKRWMLLSSAFLGSASAQAAVWQKIGGATALPGGIRLPSNKRKANTIGQNLLRSDGVALTTQTQDWAGYYASRFVAVTSLMSVVSVSRGSLNVLRADGTVWGIGSNSYGQLGDGSTSSATQYVQATGISNAIAIAGNNTLGNSYALRSDGLVFGAGIGSVGQLGTNSGNSALTYVQATGISNAIAIDAGWQGSVLALRGDGLVFACGNGASSMLGTGSSTNRSTFVQTTGVSNVIAIACGGIHSLALRSDGLVFAVGANNFGQCGDGGAGSYSTFKQVANLSNIISISASLNASYALSADGNVYVAGSGAQGELGLGSTTLARSSFVQVTDLSRIISLVAARQQTFALRSDGQLFATGNNVSGLLGVGDSSNRSTFSPVIGDF